MKWIAALIVSLQMLCWPGAVLAQDGHGYRAISTVSWVEEWDPEQARWVRVDTPVDEVLVEGVPAHIETMVERTSHGSVTTFTYEASGLPAARYAFPEPRHSQPAPKLPQAIAQYGPFIVMNAGRAAVMGSTDAASVHHFEAMLRDFPGIAVLEMIEAPGTSNDIANLAVGRRIREAGIATHVPRGGSVRSGAVELFLAGAQRSMDAGAQFAVHSWLDNHGRQPGDFAPDAPENRLYLDYYVEMGMTQDRARSFYAMTNSVPHSSAKWLDAREMQYWTEDEQRLPAHRVLPDDSRRFARGEFVIAAANATPTYLPEMMLHGITADAFVMTVALRPSIGYGNVVGDMDAMTLASATSLASDAFLDS